MLKTSPQTLKMLAAIIWFTGVVVLVTKSSGLLMSAHQSGASTVYILMAVFSGFVIGVIKTRWLFIPVCKKNLARIKALEKPKLWQCYRKRFFLFLFMMISLGRILAGMAEGNIRGLVLLAVLELSVATGLGLSSRCFFSPDNRSG